MPSISVLPLAPRLRHFPIRQLSCVNYNKFLMDKKGEKEGSSATKSNVKFKPEVHKMQQVVDADSSGGWEKCWEQGLTPWDLGQPTPVLLHLHHTGSLPEGRTLVPGCGSGHDVIAIAGPKRYVVGLDISDKAIKKARDPDELFDLIFDYTFFCAIEPEMRLQWAKRIRDLLKPDGELITLIFPMDDHVGGPPFRVSTSDYEEVLHPVGFKAVSIVDNELAVKARKGREKLGRWKRSPLAVSYL